MLPLATHCYPRVPVKRYLCRNYFKHYFENLKKCQSLTSGVAVVEVVVVDAGVVVPPDSSLLLAMIRQENPEAESL